MAELLIRVRPNDHAAEPCRWRDGEVVVVMADGHPWGPKERPETRQQLGLDDRFRIVQLPGVAADRLHFLLEPQYGIPVPDPASGVAFRSTVRKRRWQLQLADLTAVARDVLLRTKDRTTVETTRSTAHDIAWSEFRDACLDHVTQTRLRNGRL